MDDLFRFLQVHHREVLELTGRHVLIVAISESIAVLLAVPAGILVTRSAHRHYARQVLNIANVFQTVPSLAVIGLASAMLAYVKLGIGIWPALLALLLYAILPVLSNTIAGLNGVDPAVKKAAGGMGFSDKQVLRSIELPLSLPVIFAGIRTSLVINVGTAALAAAIGARCLGTLIFQGIATGNFTLLLAGAIPTALLAVILDVFLGALERRMAVPQ